MKKLLFLILFFFFLTALSASSTAEGTYAEGIKVVILTDTVLISWNVNNPQGDSLIYRHREPLTASDFEKAELIGSVAKGLSSFSWKPTDSDPWYYGVLIKSKDTIHNLFIPGGNTTLKPYAIEHPLKDNLTRIQEIQSRVTGEKSVLITYKDMNQNSNLYIIRTASPVSNHSQLVDSAVVAEVNRGTEYYVDFPDPGHHWYYTVVSLTDYLSGCIIQTGWNTTGQPVLLSPQKEKGSTAPLVAMDATLMPHEESPLSEKNQYILEKLFIEPAKPPSEPPQRLTLLKETHLGQKADEIFQNILEEKLKKGFWNEGFFQLNTLLKTVTDSKERAVIWYYMGQCHYFTGNEKEAVYAFIYSREYFFSESNTWLLPLLLREF